MFSGLLNKQPVVHFILLKCQSSNFLFMIVVIKILPVYYDGNTLRTVKVYNDDGHNPIASSRKICEPGEINKRGSNQLSV